jgi:hypothetical protein
VYLKNIGVCIGGQGLSIGTPLDPPLLWLDNIPLKKIKLAPCFKNIDFVLTTVLREHLGLNIRL